MPSLLPRKPQTPLADATPAPADEAIYQTCRKPTEIWTAFDQLQLELNFEISAAMTCTRRKLLENFDDEVRDKLEREIKELDRLIKDTRRNAATALTLEEKLANQKQIKAIESQRNDKRRSLFEAQDAIDTQREDLIGKIEGKLQQADSHTSLFTLRWALK